MFPVHAAKMTKHSELLMIIYVAYSYVLVLFLNKRIFFSVYMEKSTK
jgi:hypothetical protein